MLKNAFSIRPLESNDAALVASFMLSQNSEYLQFFYAFGSDEAAIAEMLSATKQDIYSGVFWQNELIGMFMLRGWDEGYEIPSFGILIDEKYRGQSLLSLTLETGRLICRLAGVKGFMAKHHPDNIPLRNVQQHGFYQTGIEESTGNILLFMDA